MTRRAWIAIAVAAAAGVGLAVWLARPEAPLTEAERIRARFAEAARAAEERKAGDVVEILSPRFEGGGEAGMRVTRDEVKRLVALELLRSQWVSVKILPDAQVDVRGDRARAIVDAVLSSAADPVGRLPDLLPGEYSLHRFDLELALEEGEWRVVRGAWRQIPLDEALSGPGAPEW